jgi:hypothetical protein
VLVSEGWPAWLPILPSLGVRVLALVGKKEFLEGMEDIAELEVGSVGAVNFLSALPRNTMVFVSGSTGLWCIWQSTLAGSLDLPWPLMWANG